MVLLGEDADEMTGRTICVVPFSLSLQPIYPGEAGLLFAILGTYLFMNYSCRGGGGAVTQRYSSRQLLVARSSDFTLMSLDFTLSIDEVAFSHFWRGRKAITLINHIIHIF